MMLDALSNRHLSSSRPLDVKRSSCQAYLYRGGNHAHFSSDSHSSHQVQLDSGQLGSFMENLLSGGELTHKSTDFLLDLRKLAESPGQSNSKIFEEIVSQLLSAPENEISEDGLLKVWEVYMDSPVNFSLRKILRRYIIQRLHTFTADSVIKVIKVYMRTGYADELHEEGGRFLKVIHNLYEANQLTVPSQCSEFLFFLWKLKGKDGYIGSTGENRMEMVIRLHKHQLSLSKEVLTGEELIGMFKLLVMEKIQNVDGLDTVPGKLMQCSGLDLGLWDKLLRDCVTYNYYNSALFHHVCEDICKNNPLRGPDGAKMKGDIKKFYRIITSLYRLKFNHPLACQIAVYLLEDENLTSISTSKLCLILRTLALFSITEPSVLELFDKAMAYLSSKKFVYDKRWLNSVLSAAILGRLTHNGARSVLREDFNRTPVGQANLYKFILVQCSALWDLKDYTGPLCSIPWTKDYLMEPSKPYITSMEQLHTIILGLVPEGYVQKNSPTSTCYKIDFEMMAVPPSSTSDVKFLPLPKSGEKPPDSYHRLAVLLLDSNHMLPYPPYRVGLKLMQYRHLRAMGYTVIEVPVTEILKKKHIIKHVKDFNERVGQALKEINSVKSKPTTPVSAETT